MQREQYQQIAIGAGLLAVIAAIATGRLPRWLRIMLVVALAALAGGAVSSLIDSSRILPRLPLPLAHWTAMPLGLWQLLRAEWLPRILRYVSKLSTKERHWRLQRRFRRAMSI